MLGARKSNKFSKSSKSSAIRRKSEVQKVLDATIIRLIWVS